MNRREDECKSYCQVSEGVKGEHCLCIKQERVLIKRKEEIVQTIRNPAMTKGCNFVHGNSRQSPGRLYIHISKHQLSRLFE